MNSLPVMDWNSKWDWENLVMFNSKTMESPRKQPTDWGIEEEGEIDTGSFNLYWGGGGGSSSDLAHGSSARSSISPSTDSSSKEGFHNFPGDFTKKIEFARAELAGTSPLPDSSIGSGEPLIGLKLGKRTYFENNCSGGSIKASSVSMIPVASASTMTKKLKSIQSVPTPRCQVEGCNIDLSSAKEYHRKHKVCESHSKFSKVVVSGLERRFCQQCSRFHSLSEFDEKKRSCRKRLSDHNARRRKPQQAGIQFKSTSMPSPFLDGRQQMGFWLNDAPFVHTRSSSNLPWESTSNSKFTLTKGYQMKSEKTVGVHGHLQLPGTELSHAVAIPDQNSNMPFRSKGTKPDVFTQGSKESMMLSFNSDAAQEHRALSLLSTDSWGSDPTNIPLDQQPAHVNLTTTQPSMPQSLPLSLPEYWQSERSTDSRFMHAFSANDNTHFQELFRTPYENGLYNNLLN